MSETCPKCAHQKPPGNPISCQNCGVIFSKVSALGTARPLRATEKSRFGVLHSFVLIVILFFAGVAAWNYIQKTQDGRSAAVKAEQAKQTAALADRKLAEAKRSEAQKAINALNTIMRKWDDASKLADITSRGALAAPVASLQAIRREAQDLTVPPCADDAKKLAVQAMDMSINGFMVFMQSADMKYEANKLIIEASSLMQKANFASEACNNM